MCACVCLLERESTCVSVHVSGSAACTPWLLWEGAAGDTSVAEDRPRRAYRPYLAGVTFGGGMCRALKRDDRATGCIHRCCNARPAPDALDELRDTVHCVAIVRHDAAHTPLHMHQPPVSAREHQQPALARAVVRKRNLHKSNASHTPSSNPPRAARAWAVTLGQQELTCTVRAAESVWKLIQRPIAVVRRSAIASGSSVSRAVRTRAHASSPTINRS